MSVYVDAAVWPFGRMLMCHMIADTSEELNLMADKIEVKRRWIQHPNTYREHYDICKSKRALAIRYGAIQVTMSFVGEFMEKRKNNDRLK